MSEKKVKSSVCYRHTEDFFCVPLQEGKKALHGKAPEHWLRGCCDLLSQDDVLLHIGGIAVDNGIALQKSIVPGFHICAHKIIGN